MTVGAPRTGRGFDRKLIAPMILGSVLNPVNSSMIAVALIPIGVALGAPPAETAWLVAALYLATSVGQPVAGRLVDMFGPRRLFLAGSVLVGIAGVLGTVSPDLGVLIVARVLLGVGTCAGYPAAMYLIRSEADRTGTDSPAGVLTALAVSAQTIAVIGPTLGGLLIGLGGWRTIFAVNIPLALIGLWLGWLRLPRGERGTGRKPLDLPGIGLFAGMLTALLLFLMTPRIDRWWVLALAVTLGALLTWRELKVGEPFLDLRVFGGNVPLLVTYLRNLLTAVVSYGFIYGFTQWLEETRGLSASVTGLVVLPTFLAAIVVATLTGRRPEIRGKLLVGSAVQLVGCGLLLLLHAGSAMWVIVAVALVVGIPQGLNNLANQNAVYRQADPKRMGASAGLLRTFMYLGAIASSAATAAAFPHGADTAGMHHLAVFMGVCAAILLVAVLLDRSLNRAVEAGP